MQWVFGELLLKATSRTAQKYKGKKVYVKDTCAATTQNIPVKIGAQNLKHMNPKNVLFQPIYLRRETKTILLLERNWSKAHLLWY